MSTPKISVVTPSFNQGKYLEKAILSVLEQQYPNLEYIIIDGGSTDNSVEIIKKYEKHLKYWVSEPDRGQSHAINKGLKHATGDLLAWLNSDDYYASSAFKTVAEIYDANPTIGAIVGAGDMVDEAGNVVLYKEPSVVNTEFLYRWSYDFFWQPSCFFAGTAWQECGILDENLHYAMDLDLWLKISKKYAFAVTKTLLSHSLKHDGAKTTADVVNTLVDAVMVVSRHGGENIARQIINKELAERDRQLKQLVFELDEKVLQVYHANKEIMDRNERLNYVISQLDEANGKIVGLEAQVFMLNQKIIDIYNSYSWRFTKVIRWAGRKLAFFKTSNSL